MTVCSFRISDAIFGLCFNDFHKDKTGIVFIKTIEMTARTTATAAVHAGFVFTD